MRADRLLALLMLLQSRGRMTASQLAQELEVSVRTIYRDIDALSASGVPVYTERGPNGGCALIDRYRTELTGLTAEEVKALFMFSVPSVLGDLGLADELRSALLKLSAALPGGKRIEETRSRRLFHLDSSGWFQGREPVPHLMTIQRAVWEDKRLQIVYRSRAPFRPRFEWVVDPYGLVAKTNVWHLVAAKDGSIRSYHVADILDATALDESFQRPPQFDLAAYWREWCLEVESNRSEYTVLARVSSEILPYLRHVFGDRLQVDPLLTNGGEIVGSTEITLVFESLEDARASMLGLGGAVEVLRPEALRLSVQDFARQVVARYK